MSRWLAVALALAALAAAGCGANDETGLSEAAVARGLAGEWPSCVRAGSCPDGPYRLASCTALATGDDAAGQAFDCLVELGEEGDATIVRVSCDGETCRWEPPSAPGDTGLPGDTAPPYEGSFVLVE